MAVQSSSHCPRAPIFVFRRFFACRNWTPDLFQARFGWWYDPDEAYEEWLKPNVWREIQRNKPLLLHRRSHCDAIAEYPSIDVTLPTSADLAKNCHFRSKHLEDSFSTIWCWKTILKVSMRKLSLSASTRCAWLSKRLHASNVTSICP